MNLDILNELWDEQEKFQRIAIPNWGSMDSREQSATTRDFCMYMIGEMVELLREMDWKIHRNEPGKVFSRSNVLEELVDIQKYWMSICLLHGFDLVDIVEEFRRKSAVVSQRWKQEHYEQWRSEKVVVVDIDGTLADYAGGFFKFVRQKTGFDIDYLTVRGMDLAAELTQLSDLSLQQAIQLKRQFREEGWKKDLPVLPGAREVLNAIRRHDGQIVLLSARPYALYRRVFADTIIWMQNNKLPFDALWMAENKRDFLMRSFPKVAMVVDDHPGEAMRLGQAGYFVMVPPRPYNREVEGHQNIERIPMGELADKIHRQGLPESGAWRLE